MSTQHGKHEVVTGALQERVEAHEHFTAQHAMIGIGKVIAITVLFLAFWLMATDESNAQPLPAPVSAPLSIPADIARLAGLTECADSVPLYFDSEGELYGDWNSDTRITGDECSFS